MTPPRPPALLAYGVAKPFLMVRLGHAKGHKYHPTEKDKKQNGYNINKVS
jgi:hypothetical protein